MMIFSCTCGKRYRADDDKTGYEFLCSKCGNVLTVPSHIDSGITPIPDSVYGSMSSSKFDAAAPPPVPPPILPPSPPLTPPPVQPKQKKPLWSVSAENLPSFIQVLLLLLLIIWLVLSVIVLIRIEPKPAANVVVRQEEQKAVAEEKPGDNAFLLGLQEQLTALKNDVEQKDGIITEQKKIIDEIKKENGAVEKLQKEIEQLKKDKENLPAQKDTNPIVPPTLPVLASPEEKDNGTGSVTDTGQPKRAESVDISSILEQNIDIELSGNETFKDLFQLIQNQFPSLNIVMDTKTDTAGLTLTSPAVKEPLTFHGKLNDAFVSILDKQNLAHCIKDSTLLITTKEEARIYKFMP